MGYLFFNHNRNLFDMALKNIFKKDRLTFLHIPTVFVIVGYASYWIELYFIRLGRGRTSFLAACLFIVYCIAVFVNKKGGIGSVYRSIREGFGCLKKYEKAFLGLYCVIIIPLLFCVLISLFYPIHLGQEYDVLNYHLTIPKQHLILNSFRHIKWSAADLRVLPLDFALAPYWLATELPNKLGQLLFIFGIVSVSVSLTRKIRKNNFLASCMVIAAILGSHGFGIQMGTAMLDLAICYLFIASLDSFLGKRYVLGAIEFNFFIWSKPFYSAYALLLMACFFGLRFILKRMGFDKITLSFSGDAGERNSAGFAYRKTIASIIIAAAFIGGPFICKSIYYAGTPLYPFMPGLIRLSHIDRASLHWQSVVSSSESLMAMKNSFGSEEKGFLDFLRHFWLISVPENDAVNRYDYPLGLPYLLFLIPFVYFSVRMFLDRRIVIIPFIVIIYWFIWWFGTQQTRFLFAPIVLIFVAVSCEFNKFSKAMLFALSFALALNFASILRSNIKDFVSSPRETLRAKDKDLIKMSRLYYESHLEGPVILNYSDVAYADFPVKVIAPEGRIDSRSDSEFFVLRY